MSSAGLRPGALLGAYPERPQAREGFDRTLARALGSVGAALRSRSSTIKLFLQAVGRNGERLARCGDAEVGERVHDLRTLMISEGLTDETNAQSFALIREVAGRSVGMRPYDVQLIGGWVMLNGMLAEMNTGEGKTLTATLPAATAGLAGIPVH